MKFIKYTLIALVLLPIIVIGCSYIAIASINNSYIAEKVSDAIGREIKINGEVSPKLSLIPSIQITNLVVANAEWASKNDMLTIGSVEVSMDVEKLINGEIEVESITLNDTKAFLEEKKKWNFEIEKTEVKEEKKEEAVQASIAINNIQINNLELSINQKGKKSNYKIDSLELEQTETLSIFKAVAKIDKAPLKVEANISTIKDIIDQKAVDIKDLKLAYSGYNISGKMNVMFAAKKPKISGNLNIGNIDISNKKAAAKEPESKKPAAGYSKEPLPFDILQAFDADLNLYINSFKVDDKITLSKISIPAKISAGAFKASKISADFLKSKINADVQVSKKASKIKLNTKDIELGKMFLGDDFSGGHTTLSADLNATGDSIYSLVNSLSGETKMQLKDAIYSGKVKSNILEKLFKLLAGGSSSSKTEISCVLANISWKDGIGDIKGLEVINEYAVVTGTGKIKLPSQKIKATFYPEAKNIGLTDFIVPPITMSGSFSDLSVYPDPQGTAISAVKTAAGIASGVGIFAAVGGMIADKTGLSESLGLKKERLCGQEEKSSSK